ncbi:MAG: hypothetical protein LBC62_05955 [Treponema sp.]|jgi:uncharacterized integral membrane protein|nr:hypothetical protein [Treponema sp.]
MGRLIGFILIFAVFLTFIVLNLDNKCDVSLGFRTIREIPVFITVFVSFFLGMFCAVPFAISFGRKKHLAKEASSKQAKKWGKNKDKASQLPEDLKGDGSYGID